MLLLQRVLSDFCKFYVLWYDTKKEKLTARMKGYSVKMRYLQLSFLITVLIFLPRCTWFGTPETPAETPIGEHAGVIAGEVLLTIDGQPRITMAQFEDYKKNIMEVQPQLKQLISLMPDAEYELFKSMVNEELLKDWIRTSKIDQKVEYKHDLQMILDFAGRQLAVKYFQDAHPVKVSDVDIRKFYEDNKKQFPELIVSQGGVKAQGVSFSTPADAQAFMAKAKEKGFAAAAKEANLKLEEYKDISATSYELEAPLRDKLVAVKKFPSIEMVTGKDKTYVVNATGKTEPEYVAYDQIKPRLEMYLQQQKMAENFTKELDKLKQTMNVVENKNYFDQIKGQREEEMKRMIEQEKSRQADQQAVPAPAPMAKPLKAS